MPNGTNQTRSGPCPSLALDETTLSILQLSNAAIWYSLLDLEEGSLIYLIFQERYGRVRSSCKRRILTMDPLIFQDLFRGDVIHSSEFKSARKYHGKKAIVVGAGNSGMCQRSSHRSQ